MSSWRITTNEIDRSQTLIPNIGNIGAMVVRSKRGQTEPVLIGPGQEQRILDIFGYPDATWPDVMEAIEYNKTAALWVTATEGSGDFYSALIVVFDEIVGYVGEDATAMGTAEVLQQTTASLTKTQIENYKADPSTLFTANDQYFVLYAKGPSTTDHLSSSVEFQAETNTFFITIFIEDNQGNKVRYADAYEVSLTEGATDGFGKNIFIDDVFENNDIVGVISNPTADVVSNSFTETSDSVPFSGGVKTANQSPNLVNAWQLFQKSAKYPAKIFMDPSADPTVPPEMDTLRKTYQKYSSYIFPMPMGVDASQAITDFKAFSLDERGLAGYWNHGLTRYGRRKFWTSMIGRVGRKYAQMVNVFNGLAPSWPDENNHGGQLGPGILELEFDPTETQLKQLDEANLNPIVFDNNYGVMIVSQKTATSPIPVSDDSYIGHSRLFDVILENIITQVLTPQITKLNDDIHRRRAVVITDTFMRPLTDPSLGLLNAYKIKCDAGNNDATARSQRKFVFSLAVQVTPFSEFIEFNFIKAGQAVTVDSVLR